MNPSRTCDWYAAGGLLRPSCGPSGRTPGYSQLPEHCPYCGLPTTLAQGSFVPSGTPKSELSQEDSVVITRDLQQAILTLLEGRGLAPVTCERLRIAPALPAAYLVPPTLPAAVQAELEWAVRKFPTWPTDPIHAFAVLGEEVGELNQAVLQAVYEPHKSGPEQVMTEAIQVAAMAHRFLRSLDQYVYQPQEQHQQEPLPSPQAKVKCEHCDKDSVTSVGLGHHLCEYHLSKFLNFVKERGLD